MVRLRKILILCWAVAIIYPVFGENSGAYVWRSGLGGGERHALIISGYHSFYPWTNTVLEGIYKTFRESRYEVETDTLEVDVLRIPDKALRNRIFAERLNALLRQTRYDVVILSDLDAAVAVREHLALFPADTPMVFCGIMASQGRAICRDIPNMTGVLLQVPLQETVELGIKLAPGARHVVIISDGSLAGSKIVEMVRRTLPGMFPQLDFDIWSGRELPTGEMLLRLSRLQPDAFVIITAWKYGKGERFVPQYELQQALKSRSPVPIYSIFSDWVQARTAVGGIVYSGSVHGREAALLALQIFDGKRAVDLPIRNGTSKILFHYDEMRKFGLPVSRLPINAQVLNLPGNLFRNFLQMSLAVLAVVAILLVLLAGLIVYILRYRRAVRRQRQEVEKSLAVVRVMPITMGVINDKGQYLFLNNEDDVRKRYGVSVDRPVSVFDIYEADFARYLVAHVEITRDAEMPLEVFYHYDGKEKRAVCLTLRKEIFGEPAMIFVSCDISEQKALERRQLETLEQLKMQEMMLRRATEMAGICWFLCDAQRRVIRSDNRFPVWKYDESGERLPVREVLAPDEAEKVFWLYEQLFSGERNEVHYHYHVDFDGNVRSFNARAVRLDGNQFFITVIDESEAQYKYLQLRKMIDSLPCYLFAKDTSGADYRYIFVNRHMAVRFGYDSPENLEGKCDRDFCDDDDKLIHFRQTDEQALCKGTVTFEYAIVDRDGVRVPLWVLKQRVAFSDRVVILGVALDRHLIDGDRGRLS